MLRTSILCACLPLALAAAELRLLGEARTGGPVAWELEGLPAPAAAPTPELLITGEESAHRIRAFRYRPYRRAEDGSIRPTGPIRWRLRHCFAAPGVYRLRLLAGDGTTQLAATRIEVEPTDGPHGPVRISPHNPLLLAWADGTPYVPVGINLCWANGPDRLGTFRRHLRRFAARGGNHIRLWAASWFGQIESDRPDRYRLDQAWLLDQALLAARRLGVTVTLVLDNHHDLGLGRKMPYGTTLRERLANFFAVPLHPQYARRLAYLTSRYAAFDNLMAWELFNEVDLTAAPRGRVTAWAAAATAELRRLDPHNHLRTISMSDPNWTDLFTVPGIDLTQIHQYVPYLPRAEEKHQDSMTPLLQHQLWALELGRPFCFSETGHQGTNGDNPGNEADSEGFLLQQQAWGGLLSGGYGTGMNWWWDVYVDANRLWHLYQPLADTIERIDWSDPDLKPIRPSRDIGLRLVGWQSSRQALIHPVQDSDTWYAHVVEERPRSRRDLRARAMILRDLVPDRACELIGIDMRTGDQIRRQDLRTDADGLLLVDFNPEEPDEVIVLRVRTAVEKPDPDAP